MVIPADHNFPVRRGNVDTDMVLVSLVVMPMVGFQSHPAAHNVRVKFFEFIDFFTNSGLDGFGWRNTTKNDL
jgi:hypothetical protein